MKWVKEDVVYIITDQERDAFQKLTADPERNRFVEQFWVRRNPVPGSGKNDFKEEHYRRIAYANKRFASGIAGWKTDRGRIYIIYGPPDEIESQPSKTQTSFAHEDWAYHHIEGIGDRVLLTFEDRAGKGNYTLTRDPNGR